MVGDWKDADEHRNVRALDRRNEQLSRAVTSDKIQTLFVAAKLPLGSSLIS